MKNKDIAKLFDELGDMLEFLGENPFRTRAYKRAAQIIYGLPEDVELLFKSGRLANIKGIGEGIIQKIGEFLEKGHISAYDEYKSKIPEGLLELLSVPYIGPVTLRTLYKTLHITNFDELIKACEDKLLRNLPNFGPKKEENILKGLLRYKEQTYRHPIGLIYEDIIKLKEMVKNIDGVIRVEIAGSFRRMKETIGDIDILASTKDEKKVIRAFTTLPFVKEILGKGETKSSVILANDIQADLRVVEDQSFGACLQYFTGSKNHNIKLRGIAKEKGLKINEYGIFMGDKLIPCPEEEIVYKTLGLPWIPPEIREDNGEIEAAFDNKLPKLVQFEDIKGDVHVHSKYSDGGEDIKSMAMAAKKRGYEYIVITDHSQSLKIAKGLDIERLFKQREEIEKLNKELYPFKIFHGSEVDIKNDGILDYTNDILKKLDFVIASIHSGFKENEEKIMKRLFEALENPYVTMIGHPTGRILNTREPYNVNIIELSKKAAATNTFLEINAYFDRLDLNDVNVRIAKGYGVRFCIGTDSHNSSQLAMMFYGIGQARRAWLSKEDIINTLCLTDFITAITKKRKKMKAL